MLRRTTAPDPLSSPSPNAMPFGRRPAQTRIKHGILRDYVGAWMGIICGGLFRRASAGWTPPTFDFVYLDGFAGRGAYMGDDDKPGSELVWGSPIIGAQALALQADLWQRKGLSIRTTSI